MTWPRGLASSRWPASRTLARQGLAGRLVDKTMWAPPSRWKSGRERAADRRGATRRSVGRRCPLPLRKLTRFATHCASTSCRRVATLTGGSAEPDCCRTQRAADGIASDSTHAHAPTDPPKVLCGCGRSRGQAAARQLDGPWTAHGRPAHPHSLAARPGCSGGPPTGPPTGRPLARQPAACPPAHPHGDDDDPCSRKTSSSPVMPTQLAPDALAARIA